MLYGCLTDNSLSLERFRLIESFLVDLGLGNPLWLLAAVAAIVVVSVVIGIIFNKLILPIF